MMVKVYGAVPPLQLISMLPHCVNASVSMVKEKAMAGGRIARRSDESSITATSGEAIAVMATARLSVTRRGGVKDEMKEI